MRPTNSNLDITSRWRSTGRVNTISQHCAGLVVGPVMLEILRAEPDLLRPIQSGDDGPLLDRKQRNTATEFVDGDHIAWSSTSAHQPRLRSRCAK